MKHIRDMSIGLQLRLITTLVVALSLIVASTASIIANYRSSRAATLSDLMSQTNVIGYNSTAALKFNDAAAASEVLASLQADHNIAAACLFTDKGIPIARYGSKTSNPSAPGIEGVAFVGDSAEAMLPIRLDGEYVGTVWIRMGLSQLRERLRGEIYMLLLSVALSAGVGLILIAKLQRFITAPVLELANVARAVSTEKNYALRVTKRSKNEVGILADCFNEMLTQIEANAHSQQAYKHTLEREVQTRTAELRDAQKSLIQTAREAGKAEIATSVLHNVGNVLNSLNISVGLATSKIQKSPTSDLARAIGMMTAHKEDIGDFLTLDKKGKQVVGYLATVAGIMSDERQLLLSEMESLSKNVEHIKQIVNVQQSNAKTTGMIEEVHIAELLEDALRVNSMAPANGPIRVVREFRTAPMIATDKHMVLQIVINLISNSKHAIMDIDADHRCLTVRTTIETRDEQQWLRIWVIDTGIGIEPENLTRIFNHGFTTKRDGHGFGLHSSANSAKQIGGSLNGYSEGRGKGATFILELPMNKERVHQ